jgi:Ca2+-transporting ATPase
MWGYAIVLGFLSIPVGMIIRLIPDRLIERLVPDYLKRKAHSKVPGLTVQTDEERIDFYPSPLTDIRDELAFLKRVKGGRLNNLRFAMKHPRETFLQKSRSPSHSREHSRANSINIRIPQTPTREDSFSSHSHIQTPDKKRSRSMRSRSNSALGAATVMTGIVAGSIAAGWMPAEKQRDGEGDPSQSGGSQSGVGDSQPSQHSTLFTDQPLTDEPLEMSDGASHGRHQDIPILNAPKPPSWDSKSSS